MRHGADVAPAGNRAWPLGRVAAEGPRSRLGPVRPDSPWGKHRGPPATPFSAHWVEGELPVSGELGEGGWHSGKHVTRQRQRLRRLGSWRQLFLTAFLLFEPKHSFVPDSRSVGIRMHTTRSPVLGTHDAQPGRAADPAALLGSQAPEWVPHEVPQNGCSSRQSPHLPSTILGLNPLPAHRLDGPATPPVTPTSRASRTRWGRALSLEAPPQGA